MDDDTIMDQRTLNTLSGSVLAPRIPEYCSHLRLGRYPSAKRAYAMVRCLTDLGLRASEVVQLQLDDIDWRAGTLRLAKGKGS